MPAARRPSDGDLVLGLDFGTTNSAVAVVQDGVVDVLVNDVGNRLTPSCVHVGADQARQVGEGALRMAVSDPGNTVRNVKRVLGLPVEAVKQASGLLGTVQVGNSNDGSGGAVLVLGDGAGPLLAAEEVVAALLHELKKAAEAQLGRGASGAVIAVPTYFNAAQRHAVRDAGQLAGLEVLRLVNEPTAAAVAYAYDKEFTKTIVVVDVGGGGSSISVLRVESNEITVLASSAARLPGGEDFDQKMVEYLREVIRERHEHTVEDARSLELLRTHWEKAKQRLSRIPVAKIATFLPDAGLEFEHEVKRADMDRCAPLFHEITAAMKSVLEAAETAPEAVDDVLLVGGSTRIPRLRDLVQEALGGKRLCKAVHQDEEVSKGAALLGAGLCAVRDLTPLHLSVHTNGEEFTVLPNTPLPHTFDLRGQGQGPGQAMVRQGPWVPSGLQGDGDMPMTSIFELTKKSRVAFARLLLDESGLVHLLDACGFLLHVVPRSCLSEQKLRDLQGKHEARQRDQDMEQCRMEEKNALEDKCRTLMAVQVSDDDPDARHILALKQKCQEGLEWLQNNDDAHLQDVKGKLTEIACLEAEVHARQADRRARDSHAREAEIQRVEAREFLMELCRNVRDMQAPDGDSDAADLRQECVHILHWLHDNPGVALADIDPKFATVLKKRDDLEEKRALAQERERAVRERTAAARSRSYAFAASQPPRGVRQADQEWPRGSDPKAFHVSGRDNWQGERVDQPQNFLRNYRNMGVFSGSSYDCGTLRRVEEGSFSRYPNKKRKWLDGCTIV